MSTREERVQKAVREEVAIVPYDPRWPELFRREAAHLRSCLPVGLIRRIEHFGSHQYQMFLRLASDTDAKSPNRAGANRWPP
jgi:GrpB protein